MTTDTEALIQQIRDSATISYRRHHASARRMTELRMQQMITNSQRRAHDVVASKYEAPHG